MLDGTPRDLTLACAFVCILSLYGCGSTSQVPAGISTQATLQHGGGPVNLLGPGPGPLPPIADDDIDQHIDSSLPENEKLIMHNLMKRIHPSDRYYVLFFDKDGNNYANTLDAHKNMQRWQAVGKNRFTKPNGEVVIGPEKDTPQQIKTIKKVGASIAYSKVAPLGYGTPGYSEDTGALRRVFSSDGSSEIRTDVYIPCRASNFQGAPNATGYVYEGGFGVSYDQLDAGFEYSFINDHYSLFTRDAANDGTNQISADGAPFSCGQTATLDFYSLADPNDPSTSPQTVIAATGYDTTGAYTTHSAVDTVPPSEWPNSGVGMQVKRMTTIAQTPSDFTSGYYFGFDPTSNGPSITWSNSQIGTSGTSLYTWPNNNGGTQSFPSDESQVLVNYIDQADETDGINLHQ